MIITPIGKKFGKYKPGDQFTMPDKIANALIKSGKVRSVLAQPAAGYQTRALQAEPSAPYGVKVDGTPKKRPGRQAAHA